MQRVGGNQVIQIQTVLFNNTEETVKRWLTAVVANINFLEKEGFKFVVSIAVNDQKKEIEKNIMSFAAKYIPNIELKILIPQINMGHGQAHNLLSKATSDHDFLWISNPDGIPDIDCLKELLESMNENAKVAATEARQIPFDHPKIFDFSNLRTEWISGACFLIRSKIFSQVDGFDKYFFLHGDDIDLSWRLRNVGYDLKYVPSARFFHDKLISQNGYPSLSPSESIYGPLGALLLAYKYGLRFGLQEMVKELESRTDESAKLILAKFNESKSVYEFGEFSDNRYARYYSPWSFSKKLFV